MTNDRERMRDEKVECDASREYGVPVMPFSVGFVPRRNITKFEPQKPAGIWENNVPIIMASALLVWLGACAAVIAFSP